MSADAGPGEARAGTALRGGAADAARLHTNTRTPDFFIIGQPKSGTTALYEMLRLHPQIYMPDSKEPWFFAAELQHRSPPRPEGIPETFEDYLALFQAARSEQRVGEASPLYLWSQTAAAAIAAVQPGARIIAILREPVSLLHSLHLQFLKTYIETEPDFGKAIALEASRREGRDIPRYTYWPQALLYSEHVRYVEQLKRYRDLFGAEQMLVLIYDDFRRDNDETVRRVLRFLEVDAEAPIALREANPTVGMRSQRVHELFHAVSVGRGPVSRAVKGAIKAATPRPLRRQALDAAQRRIVYVEPQPPDERLALELRRRFKPQVQALGEYLDRDLVSLWGYGDVS
ncbi:MAG TPA: sulfotransferase [Solirubrobacteraceae bacterium]|nr:sulfotransferase [Solirubrobacteraceae bacterium]